MYPSPPLGDHVHVESTLALYGPPTQGLGVPVGAASAAGPWMFIITNLNVFSACRVEM